MVDKGFIVSLIEVRLAGNAGSDSYVMWVLALLQVEEAEWVGLSVPEALRKAREAEAKNNPPRPLKDMFIVQLAQKIAGGV